MAEDLAGLSIPIEASTALLREQMEAAAQVVGGTTDRIDRNLAKVDKAFDRLDQASRAVKRAVGGVQKDLDAAAARVGTAAERINRSLGIIGQGGSTRSRAADIEAWGRELDRLEAKFDPVTTATKRYEAELADLQAAQRAGIVTGAAYEQQLQRIADNYDPVTVAARKLKEAAEQEAVAFQALENRLDSHGAAARRAADDQAKLDKALAENRISYDRYTILSRALRDTGSAGETAAKGTKLASHELTNLTYQLQDAAVTLAGGMNPLMVLMQQGPQATSAVGGVGRAMSLLVSPAGLATLGIGAVAAAFALVMTAGESYQRKLAEVSTANRMMGGQVGATADQLERLATRAADAASISVSAARDQETAYIRAGKIGTESMEKLIALSRDYAAGAKQSADEASADLAGMFKDPVVAAEKLQASYGILTAKEMEHVRQLKATGREEEARVLVADKLAVRVRGLADNTTTFAQAWERVGKAVSNAFNAVGQAVAPETNDQAIRRLEGERQRLIDARKLDRARIDAETGGAAGSEAVPIDSRLAPPGMTGSDQELAAKEAELDRRRAARAREREQAAIRKNNQDRDQFGVEAAEITRAARPLGTEILDVTEKVTKLRRAFGPDMAGATDETKRALAGLENQLADLNAATKDGGLDAYKRRLQDEAGKQAATLTGPAREKFLAERQREIDLIGTATSKTERKTQVDQAGAAVTNAQTAAVAQQNAQTTAAIKGQVAAADAYQQSLAAGIEADARRQAQSEAVTSAIDVEARTRQIVAEKAADQAVSLAQTTQQLDLETAAQRKVVDATDDGVAARMEAERQAQVAKTMSEALAAAQAAEATGNAELAKKLRDLAAGYDDASKAASELSKLDALKQYNQQQRDGLELARNEASLVGKSADDRTRARAAYQAELQIRQKGIDVTKELSAEQRQEVERARQLAAETADWQIATQHAEDAWQGVGDAIDQGVVRPLESAVDAIVKGQGETVKWGNVARGALTSLAVDIGKMATINPLKNALGLGSNSPSLWDLPMLGGGGQQQVIHNADGSTSYAPAVQGVGGTWMSQPVFGQQVTPSKDFVGPMPAAEGLLGWNPSYGQLAMGGLAVAGGIATAAQKNASTGQVIGGGLTAAGGVLLTMQNSYAKTAGAILSVGGALLSAVSGAKDRGDKYSISHITLGANGRYALGASAQDNDGDPTRFNSDANKLAKGLNDIIGRLNLTPTNKDSYIDSKTKSAEQAALELLKGMQSAVPAVAYALAHETSTSLEEALSHLEFANGFDQQIAGLRSSISDLFTQFQSGVDGANTFARGLLDTVANGQTVFAVAKGATLPGFASGTPNAPAGYAIVGEEGPELVRLAGGERIWNARESAAMLAQMGQGRDDTLIHLRGSDELAAVRRALGHPGTVNPETGLLGFEFGGGDHGSPGSGGSAGTGGGSSGNSSGSSGGGSGGSGTGSEGPSISRTSSTPMSPGDMQSYGGYSFGSFTADDRSSTIGFGGAASYASPTSEQVTATAAAVDNVFGTSLAGWLENAALKYGLNINKSIGVDPETGLNNTQLSINGAGLAGDIASLATGIPGLGLALGALADQLGVDHIAIGSIDANGKFSGATGTGSTASGAIARNGGDPDRYSTNLAATETRAAADRDAAAAAQKAADDAAAQKAAQRAALQVQFDAVGLAQDRVDELNTIVKSLGDGTFSPIGKDFDTLAADMKRAATAYTAAGQAVPDALFGATKQMETLGAVRQRLMAEVDGVTVETSAEEKKVEQIKGQWSTSATDLVKVFASVGIVGEELTATLNKGLNNALNKERTSYSGTLDTALRKARGEDGYDSAVTLIDGYKTAIKNVNALWPEGTERAGKLTTVTDTLTANLEGLVKSGSITSTSLQQIITDFADTPAVVTAAAAALQQLKDAAAESTRQFNAGVTARIAAALGNDRGSQLTTLDEQQKKELKTAQDAGYDVTQLIQVQASERATKAYELANADLLAAYDQQIGATQDLITGLQDGAVAAAKVADQFIKARNSLAISDDAPISPGEKQAEAARQWSEALATVRSDSASESEKTDARAVLTQIGPTLVSIEKANSAGTSRTWYDAVMQVFGELGDKTALGVDTADQQLEAAQDTLKELQQGRKDAVNAAQKQYGAITDLKSVAEQSKAEMLSALAPLQRLTGSTVTGPHYSASAQVQTAWDGLSGTQQLGIARAMGWGGQLDEAFNVWLAMDSGRATAFGANVTGIAGGARYAAPEDVGRAWDALTQAQQLAAVRVAGYDGGIDAGLNAWVQLGHQAAFEAAVRGQAHTAQVPGFAIGGMHAGGLRIVGERGPELEATGPARIWTADQIATAVSAARGELGPTVVGFLPAALGGGSGIAMLVKAVEAVGGRIDSLSRQIETFARAGAQQADAIGTDMVRTLGRIQDELQDLPVRIAGAS